MIFPSYEKNKNKNKIGNMDADDLEVLLADPVQLTLA